MSTAAPSPTPTPEQDRAIARVQRRLSHSVAKVWRALATPQGMSAWLSADVQFDSLVASQHVASRAHAVVLAGGSGFGLSAADPVVDWLAARGYGFQTGIAPVQLVATAIHRNSDRAGRPFVKVNCAALSPTLLESELFGHEKGAFTGAVGRRVGRFEQASGGTLFLDEIGKLDIDLQAKLLRVLQFGQLDRVGGNETLQVDVRVLAATNRDLAARIAEGRFREDLFYRLNVVTIEMPPLRERKEDIAALATFFINRFAGELKKKIDGLAPDALKLLMRYHWPGNIRELENAVERAMLLADGSHISAEDLRLGETGVVGTPRDNQSVIRIPPTGIALEEIERMALIEALKMSNWVQKDAAELLSISPRVMNYKIKTLGIDYSRGRRPMVEQLV